MAVSGQVSSENLSHQVYSDLRMKLIVGDLKPAEAVSIRTLADEYGVSAMPVREALRQLASEQALIGAPKRAYRVPDLAPGEAANLFFVRSVLEGAAAEIAAKNVRPRDLKQLDRMAKEMEKAWVDQDARALLLVNFRFHGLVNNLAGNDALLSMIEGLYVRTGPWLAHGIINLVTPEHWLGDHVEIIAALRRNDGQAARRLMEEDARWGANLYQSIG